METLLLVEEIACVQSMPGDTSTGLHGSRSVIIQLHVGWWAQTLTTVFERSIQSENHLPSPLKMVIVEQFYKKWDPRFCENYKPISLLTTVIKILTKAYSFRLKQLMPKLTPTAQTGLVPVWGIPKKLILLQDALHCYKIHNFPIILVSLDFPGAYYRVRWLYFHDVMCHLRFLPRWCYSWKVLFNKRTPRLNINGRLSFLFQYTVAAIQEDPLSPYFFFPQMPSLVYKMDRLCHSHSIHLSVTECAPPATFYGDATAIVPRSPLHAVTCVMLPLWPVKELGLNCSTTSALQSLQFQHDRHFLTVSPFLHRTNVPKSLYTQWGQTSLKNRKSVY